MPTSRSTLTDRDIELLSAYRDGELSARERAEVEHHLADDASWRDALASIEQTHSLLNDLPRLRAPRNFTLDPAVYSRKPAWWQVVLTPRVLQFSGALGAAAAAILIVIGALTGTTQEKALSTVGQSEVAAAPTATLEVQANMAAGTIAESSLSPQPQPMTATPAVLPTGTPQIEMYAAQAAEGEMNPTSPEALSAPYGAAAQPELDGAPAPASDSFSPEATIQPPAVAFDSAAESAADSGGGTGEAQSTLSAFREQEEAEQPAPAAAAPQMAVTETAADAITLAEPAVQQAEMATETVPAEAAKEAAPAQTTSTSRNWALIGSGAGLLILSGVVFVLGRKNSRRT
ncbi:MAG TPA: zf-HC2 domain-containing protein [Aggregatilinea sp.]|uniref:anti-sigma factor family protein n=1 Tax=Aggregatilinea sp. TaxID=2806333 RepID=UPI002C5EDD8C|nr:zf-HC2 domain-containing protein [Aggregatilinea sp.]HML20017.1 zf-HC2 domain-containing protein [Aggregatilinea sp.]